MRRRESGDAAAAAAAAEAEAAESAACATGEARVGERTGGAASQAAAPAPKKSRPSMWSKSASAPAIETRDSTSCSHATRISSRSSVGQCSGGVGRRPSNATFQAAMSGVMLANGTSCDTISHITRPNE